MNRERWPTEPFAAVEPDYLTEAEVREREEAYYLGPHTMEHAADCGLLAFAVPTAYGGLYLNRVRQFGVLTHRMRLGESNGFLRQGWAIRSHYDACSEILRRGSYAQYDFFLPQLAAGKRVAINVVHSRLMRAQSEDDAYILTGSGVHVSPFEEYHLLVLRVRLNRHECYFVLPAAAITGVRKSGCGNTYFWIDRYVAGKETLLDSDFRQVSSTEKWEAIRWRTDRSAS